MGFIGAFLKQVERFFNRLCLLKNLSRVKKEKKKRKYNRQENLPLKRRHIKGRRAPDKPLKDNFKRYHYSKRDNKTSKTPFSYKSQDKIKEISGMAYYNYGKEGYITRGYC